MLPSCGTLVPSQLFQATVASQNHSAPHKRRGICGSICCGKQVLQKPTWADTPGAGTAELRSPSSAHITSVPLAAHRARPSAHRCSPRCAQRTAEGSRRSIASDSDNCCSSWAPRCAKAWLELTAGDPDRTPAPPADANSSVLLAQPGPGGSATHGTPGGRARPTRRAQRGSTPRGPTLPRQSLTRPCVRTARPRRTPAPAKAEHGPATAQAAAEQLPGHGTAGRQRCPLPSRRDGPSGSRRLPGAGALLTPTPSPPCSPAAEPLPPASPAAPQPGQALPGSRAGPARPHEANGWAEAGGSGRRAGSTAESLPAEAEPARAYRAGPGAPPMWPRGRPAGAS